jgi:hypothetical protein
MFSCWIVTNITSALGTVLPEFKSSDFWIGNGKMSGSELNGK